MQPDGSKATISWVTVGGRTSAVVEELQRLPTGIVAKKPAPQGGRKRKARGDVRGDARSVGVPARPRSARADLLAGARSERAA